MPAALLIAVGLVAAAVSSQAAEALTPAQSTAAKKLYVAKCAKCHRFYEPSAYPDDAWAAWMKSMSRKSKLKPDQASLLTQYLEEYRAVKRAAAPNR